MLLSENLGAKRNLKVILMAEPPQEFHALPFCHRGGKKSFFLPMVKTGFLPCRSTFFFWLYCRTTCLSKDTRAIDILNIRATVLIDNNANITRLNGVLPNQGEICRIDCTSQVPVITINKPDLVRKYLSFLHHE